MAKTYNLARMSSLTTGAGTLTLASAVPGYLSFAAAGVNNGEVVAYGIKDGANSETGTGLYSSAGTTLTRNVTTSTNGNAAINLSGTAEIYLTTRKEDLLMMSETQAANTFLAGPSSGAAALPAFRGLAGLDQTSGNKILLNTLVASGSATLQDTTSFTATYDRYELILYDILAATNAGTFQMFMHEAGTFPVTGYLTSIYAGNSSSALGAMTSQTTYIPLSQVNVMASAATGGWSGRIEIFNPAGTTSPKKFIGEGAHLDSNGTLETYKVAGIWNGVAAVDGFQLKMLAGNITSGIVKVYGIVN